jgi:hypothetical protein
MTKGKVFSVPRIANSEITLNVPVDQEHNSNPPMDFQKKHSVPRSEDREPLAMEMISTAAPYF